MPTLDHIRSQLAELGITGIPARQEGYNALVEVLRDGERILSAVAGEYEKAYGAAVATDQRVVFVGRTTGLFKKLRTEQFLYSALSSVQVRQGKVLALIEVFASGNTAKIDKVPNPAAMSFAETVNQHMATVKSPAPTTPAVDVADQLTKLAKLRDDGILTEAEFQAQKQKLLGS